MYFTSFADITTSCTSIFLYKTSQLSLNYGCSILMELWAGYLLGKYSYDSVMHGNNNALNM